jgi:hypothetical protein
MLGTEPSPLIALSESYILEACADISPQLLAELRQIVEHFLSHILTYDRASVIFLDKIQTDIPLRRISGILSVPETPIPSGWDQSTPYFQLPKPSTSSRKKSRPWTEYEDQRLFCAVHNHGLDHWGEVSGFVGNGRTRAQCSQRWFRGLDPRISRVLWTPEEEQKLLSLVRVHGKHAWMKIATELGTRSDSQCRYHYHHMIKDKPLPEDLRITESSSAPIPKVEEFEQPPLIGSSSAEFLFPRKRMQLPPIKELIGAVDLKWEGRRI